MLRTANVSTSQTLSLTTIVCFRWQVHGSLTLDPILGNRRLPARLEQCMLYQYSAEATGTLWGIVSCFFPHRDLLLLH